MRISNTSYEGIDVIVRSAPAILEGETSLKKRIRQVRDSLNKCDNPEIIERVASLLDKKRNILFHQATDEKGEFTQISIQVPSWIDIPESLRKFGNVNEAGETWLCDIPIA